MSGTELSATATKKAFICNRLRKKEQFFEPMKNLNKKNISGYGKGISGEDKAIVKLSTSSKQMLHLNC